LFVSYAHILANKEQSSLFGLLQIPAY